MDKFEEFTLDQFPLRDSFRTLKSLFTYNVLQQKDNNGIYIADGYAAKLEYPLNEYRACYKCAGLPLVQRLCDKSHQWGAVAKLLPDILTQGILGFAYGCPDRSAAAPSRTSCRAHRPSSRNCSPDTHSVPR